MAYNTSKGKRDLGDIEYEGDTDTQIDFENNQISLKTGGVNRLTATNTHVSCSVNVSASAYYGDGSTLSNLPAAGISWDGSTANGVATYKDADEATVEANLTFDGTTLTVTGDSTIDKNHSDTAQSSITGLYVDIDKTGASTSNNTLYGLNIDMDNTTATDGTNYMYGLYVTPTLTHAANAGVPIVYGALINAQGGTNGTSLVQGARIEAGGGDLNYGLQLDVEDGGVDLRIESSADNGDYFQIQTTTHGATVITTQDDNATAAHLTFNVDGDITLDPVGGGVFVDGNISASMNISASAFRGLAQRVTFPIKTVTNVYTASVKDYTILADTSTRNITVLLPSAATANGKIYNIKKTDSLNTLTITSSAGSTIDSATSKSVTTINQSVTVHSNGSYWFII